VPLRIGGDGNTEYDRIIIIAIKNRKKKYYTNSDVDKNISTPNPPSYVNLITHSFKLINKNDNDA
jgi:hypothetical protein